MTNTDLLIKKIDESGFKRSYIAKALGLSTYGFANKVNNKTEFYSSEIKILCELLHIDTLEERENIFFAC